VLSDGKLIKDFFKQPLLVLVVLKLDIKRF